VTEAVVDVAADRTTVLWLTEYQTLSTDALTPAKAQLLRADYARYVTVQPTFEQGVVELTAGDFIGVIALDGLRIHIRPKVPLTNLFYMLTYAYELAQFRDTETPLAVGDELFEFLVDIFVKQVDALVRAGIYRGYVDFNDDAAFLRGRLLVADHIRRGATCLTSFPQRTNEFTADLPENRILKFTLWQLARALSGDVERRRHLRRTLSAFSEVELAAMSAADCERVVYSRLNGAYRTPINLARLFLQHLSLEGHAGETPFVTYLLPMHRVFELFVGRYLTEALAGDPRHNVALQQQIWLDTDQSEQGVPDIVLHRDGRPYLVLDTKYKTFSSAPDEADRNQIYVYSQTMEVDRAILIYADAKPVHYQRLFKGMTLAAQSLPLDGPLDDFRARCAAWADGLLEMQREEETN
jgi:5-methylcytosine-specific restriction enzyme subunit McrC